MSPIRYLSLDDACAEARRRFADAKLREEVEGFLGDKLLAPFAARPRALFFRQIASPDQAVAMFWYFAKYMALDPLLLEFHDDYFPAATTTRWDTSARWFATRREHCSMSVSRAEIQTTAASSRKSNAGMAARLSGFTMN